jgi:hypothetical protein
MMELDEDIAYALAVRLRKAKLLIAQYDALRIGLRVCQKGCGQYYDPTYGHRCE